MDVMMMMIHPSFPSFIQRSTAKTLLIFLMHGALQFEQDTIVHNR